MTDRTPATTSSAPAVPTEDPWAELKAAFDDGSASFREHIGLMLPRLRSDFGKNGAGWIDDLTGETFRELDITVLAFPPQRTFWLKSLDEAEGESGPPDCKSWDMRFPDPSSPDRQAASCAECPWSKWGSDLKGGDGKACKESVAVIAYDWQNDRFVGLRFASTAMKPFRLFVSAMESRRRPVFSVRASVTLEKQTKARLEWLVPKFTVDQYLTPEDARPLREVAAVAMEAWRSALEDLAQAEEMAPQDVAAAFDASEEPF